MALGRNGGEVAREARAEIVTTTGLEIFTIDLPRCASHYGMSFVKFVGGKVQGVKLFYALL
jgi:hypothetical protein